ncbi:MAG: hypothetical protein JKX79_09840, partial [Labilibaculum sp.]|nr:hypothetical protein [Labilibaculum sp.]
MDISDENQGIFLIAKEGTEYRIAAMQSGADLRVPKMGEAVNLNAIKPLNHW